MSRISPAHGLLALAVVAVWGTNFVVIKAALDQLPPLLLGTLRFLLALVPAMFFLPRPRVPLSNLAGYGLLIGAGQFGMLYLAIDGRISPGLASLVVQTQVFFTIGLAMWLAGERIRGYQVIAVLVAAAGLAVVGWHTDATTTVAGLLLVLGAAASWAGGNILTKRAGSINMVAYVVWSSAFAVPVLFALSLAFEGWDRIAASVQQASPGAWAAVGWQSWANSLFGYAAWNWLLSRYTAATVTPLALLIPVFGMGASALWLGEPLPAWKLVAAALVISGLALNLLWPQARIGVPGGELKKR
ncbi:EamA family transporter [Ramlibacter henchirensis]|uniref:EamA family transporter n=1 Tax=Ramlibacter henchirensis TaxID=204072 RepID=A0A4Z0C4U5_9BURK|nr:EamA family transporter [Ramlibacter henchirensis]